MTIGLHDVGELVGLVGGLGSVWGMFRRIVRYFDAIEDRLSSLEQATRAQNPTLEWQTRALAQVCERTRTVPPPGPRPRLTTLTDAHDSSVPPPPPEPTE